MQYVIVRRKADSADTTEYLAPDDADTAYTTDLSEAVTFTSLTLARLNCNPVYEYVKRI